MEAVNLAAARCDDWADYYDILDLDRSPDIAFYGSIIRSGDHALIELAYGTGKITV
jgi:hypothetical protein